MEITEKHLYKDGITHFHVLTGINDNLLFDAPYENLPDALAALFDIVNSTLPGFLSSSEQTEIYTELTKAADDITSSASVRVNMGPMGWSVEECEGCLMATLN